MIESELGNVQKVLDRCNAWDVEAVAIGEVIKEKRNIVKFNGTEILNLDLEFTTGGPVYNRPYVLPEIDNLEPTELPPFPTDLSETIRNIVGNPEVSSKDWVIRQYDQK